MTKKNSPVDTTVNAYSTRGAKVYEDHMNKIFVYGEITTRFLQQIKLNPGDKTVLDIGCGSGFGFDVLGDQFEELDLSGIGIDPSVGMLEVARVKFKDSPRYEFHEGSFEALPVGDASVDRLISTLALHWVKSLEVAAAEMLRILKPGGSGDILMVGRNDGANFKKSIVAAQRKHLTFAQIMESAVLVQRVNAEKAKQAFAVFDDNYVVEAIEHGDIAYGDFEEHMKWWTARSTQVISEVEDKERFMIDLQTELEKTRTDKGIPFDASVLWITIRGK